MSQSSSSEYRSDQTTECRPWPLDIDPPTDQPRQCRDEPAVPVRSPQRPPRAKTKTDDCCQQIIELLQEPSRSRRGRLHKPKQSVKTKTFNLCADSSVKNAVVPILMVFLRRYLDGAQPVNSYEAQIQDHLRNLPSATIELLQGGLSAYEAVPKAVKECTFETRFDGCDSAEVLNPDFILKALLQEIVHRGTQTLYDLPSGLLGPGQVRPWEKIFVALPDSGAPPPETAPWPWICAVNPGADGINWYKNKEVTRPGNLSLSSFIFDDRYEMAHECTSPTVDPANPKGGFKFDCHFKTPPPGRPGDIAGGGYCFGNSRYDFPWPTGTICLAPPKVTPGQAVALRGLNFFAKTCKIRLSRKAGGFPDQYFEAVPSGDLTTPLMRDGKVVATCEVHDIVTFTIPHKITQGLNDIPVPPGIYTVEVLVPNDIGYAPAAGIPPKEFVSNDIWLDVQPSPDVGYRVTTDEAFCIEETDGLGSDEPWFRAFVARFIPAGTSPVTILPQTDFTIMEADDVDSGEVIGLAAPDLFNGKFSPGEVCAVAVLGLEVDGEEAAKENIRGFAEAYGDYWKSFFAITATGADVSVVVALLQRGVATAVSIAVGVVMLFAIGLIGVLYAVWAPADPIGIDVLVFDSVNLYWRTQPGVPLPPGDKQSYGDLSTEVTPLSKLPRPGGTSALYSEYRLYRSEDEDSTYRLTYRVERI